MKPNEIDFTSSAKSDFPKLVVFPQPVTDKINLYFENYTFNQIQAWLVNQSGHQVKYQKINGESQPMLSVQDLPSGNYTLYIYLDHKFTYSEKLILVE